MQLVRRLFQKFRSCLIRRTFTGWFKDSGINKIGKDSIDIIFESMFVPEPAACFIKLETIVKSLRKKIPSTTEYLPAIIQLLVRMKSYLDSFGLLLLFIFKSFYPGFLFSPFHDIITSGAMFNQKLLKCSELTYIDGRTFSFIVNKTFCDIKRFGIF